MYIGLFAGDEEEAAIGLRTAKTVEACELFEAGCTTVAGMPVAVEVHDHSRIDSHILKYWFKWRRPFLAVLHGLNRIRDMPMRGKRFVALERRKAVAMRVASDLIERIARCSIGHQQEHRQALLRAGWSVRPGIENPVLVGMLANADAGLSAERARPVESEITGEVSRDEILMGGGERGQ